MFKNVASQKLVVFAWDTSADTEKTGDAANITARLSKDGGATAASNDVNPTELSATDAPGVYVFDLTQAETNGDLITLFAKSSTANIKIEPVVVYTVQQLEVSGGKVNLQSDQSAVTIGGTNKDADTLHRGTAVGGGTNTVDLAATASIINGFYVGRRVNTVSGTGVGQSARCIAYNGAIKRVTVEPAWTTAPGAGTVITIQGLARGDMVGTKNTLDDLNDLASAAQSSELPANFVDLSVSATTGLVNVSDKTGFELSSGSQANVAAAVWSIATSTLTVAGTVGKRILDDFGTLLGRLTATRAGYLDNLNVSGLVAASAEVLAIQNNTRTTIAVPGVLERPDAGSTRFKLYLNNYDTAGNMEAPDSAPTCAVVNEEGVSRSGNLQNPGSHVAQTSMVLIETGRYWIEYDLDNTDAIEGLVFTFSVVEGGVTRKFDRVAMVVDTTAVDFTAADRAMLATLHDTRLTSARATNLDNLDAQVSTRSSHSAADVWTATTRTLSSFGTLVADVWANAGRTITGLTTAALAAFSNTDSGETAPVAGSVTKLAQGSAGGNVTVGDLTPAALAKFANTDSGETTSVTGSVTKLAQGAGGSGDTIILGPLVSTRDPGNRTASPIALEMFQGEAKTFALTVLDAAGAAVDLSGLTLRFVVMDVNGTGQFDVEDGSITRSGTSNEIAQVAVSATDSAAAASDWHWRLLDVTTPASPQVLLHGSVLVRVSVTDVA